MKQDGLVHISQLSNTYVSDPADLVKLQQKVRVTVTEVDVSRKRIALSMKDQSSKAPQQSRKDIIPQKQQAIKAAMPDNPFQAKLNELKKKFKE